MQGANKLRKKQPYGQMSSDYRRARSHLNAAQTFARGYLGNPHVLVVFAKTSAQTATYLNWPLIGSRTSILKNLPNLI
jgi:hypothetical protein